jgi:hypothetical protein
MTCSRPSRARWSDESPRLRASASQSSRGTPLPRCLELRACGCPDTRGATLPGRLNTDRVVTWWVWAHTP